MKASAMRPEEIEAASFAIITEEMGDRQPSEETSPIVKRVIHTTADFDYADNLKFSDGVVAAAKKALMAGAVIVTDTNMAKAGINKAGLSKLGGEVHCFIADEDVAAQAKASGTTRAVAAMDKVARLYGKGKPLIIVVGNAPTALIRMLELYKTGILSPAFVVGAPVGFVNVVESKEMLLESGVPSIVARGRKGGSNVAAAIINALVYKTIEGLGSK